VAVKITRMLRVWWKSKGPAASDWVASHAFVIGVLLFFVSRLYAFGLAAHGLFAAAP
jgi:hypothetical protein